MKLCSHRFLFALAAISAPVHDPSTGFHDIKPIPLFHPLPIWLIVAMILILALAALFALKRYSSKNIGFTAGQAPLSADRRALAELKRLDQLRQSREVDIRSLATALSLTLRRYFEEVCLFPASDMTSREVCQQLPARLKRRLPVLPQQIIDQYLENTGQLLRLWERMTFSTDSEGSFSLDCPPLNNSIEAVGALIREISAALKREELRTAGIISQSKLAGG